MLDLDMGKYAVFVWPAYGLTALVILWMVFDSLGRARRWRIKAAKIDAGAQDRP
jgi:heme exporter protein D